MTLETETLRDMLSYRRPAGSKTEKQFIRDHILPLGVERDAVGNLIKRIGDAPILWSSHTDTVHRQGGRQSVIERNGQLATWSKGSNCLGADDTAGIFVMSEMIRAHVPGMYVFHRGEEIGGVGSTYVAYRTPELLDGIRAAVAFDRKGTDEIITHQLGRCCSDDFARSLAAAIGMKHRPSPDGMFTDTANYTGIVGECSNVSVGYAFAHTHKETLETGYVLRLRDAMCVGDFSGLEFQRSPGEDDPDDYSFNRYGWHDDDFADNVREFRPRSSNTTIARVLRDHPDEIADWLEEYGITADELLEAAYMRGAVVRGGAL